MTLPWHVAGLLGMPRRMAYFDYSNPALAPEAWTVSAAVVGGAMMLASGALFLVILLRSHGQSRVTLVPYRFSATVHPVVSVIPVLNGYWVWVTLMIALTLANYGVPIAQLVAAKTSVPAVLYFNR
jgi:cytochrome c oxidase subunit 1